MHWAPIPITEFGVPSVEAHLPDGEVYRLLSRACRRGFWLSATAFVALLAAGLVSVAIGDVILGASLFALALVVGTGHIMVRHKLNAALWVTREPAAVYWAELREWPRDKTALILHTPAPVRLEVMLGHGELIPLLHWLRQRNPDTLIGSYSPNDSDGRLSGSDPWSPPTGDADSSVANHPSSSKRQS